MKLLIKTPFEIDVELVDQMPDYLKIANNWVTDQTIEVDEQEMTKLLSYLKFSSFDFNRSNITKIDEITLSWG
jgi:hypothetical protein